VRELGLHHAAVVLVAEGPGAAMHHHDDRTRIAQPGQGVQVERLRRIGAVAQVALDLRARWQLRLHVRQARRQRQRQQQGGHHQQSSQQHAGTPRGFQQRTPRGARR
jgi:hypothetical protein